jgi:O-antigen ligase
MGDLAPATRGAGVSLPVAGAAGIRLSRAQGQRSLRALALVLPPVLALYALFDKGFAYVHIPGMTVYTGEVLVALVFVITVFATVHLRMGLSRSVPMVLLGLLMLWGLARALPGFSPYGLDAARDSALWYYAFVAFGVCALCAALPALPETWARQYLWLVPLLLLWSMPALSLASLTSPRVPGTDISVFYHKPGNVGVQAAIAVCALWLLPLGPRMKRLRIPLMGLGVLAILVAGTQNRGGLVAAVAGLGVCVLLTQQRARLIIVGVVAGAFILSMAWATDISYTGPQGRAVSASQLINNVTSVAGGSSSDSNLSSTVAWRNQLWGTAFSRTIESGQLATGWGFGINVAKELGVPEANFNPPLRTPHNSHLDMLVRTGLIGSALWILLWIAWFGQMLGAHRRLRGPANRTRRAILAVVVASVTAILVNAFFDPTLESPQVAVWLWALVGLGVGISVARPNPAPLGAR